MDRIKGHIQVSPISLDTLLLLCLRNSSNEMLGAVCPLLVPLTAKMASGDYLGRRAEDAAGFSKAGESDGGCLAPGPRPHLPSLPIFLPEKPVSGPPDPSQGPSARAPSHLMYVRPTPCILPHAPSSVLPGSGQLVCGWATEKREEGCPGAEYPSTWPRMHAYIPCAPWQLICPGTGDPWPRRDGSPFQQC